MIDWDELKQRYNAAKNWNDSCILDSAEQLEIHYEMEAVEAEFIESVFKAFPTIVKENEQLRRELDETESELTRAIAQAAMIRQELEAREKEYIEECNKHFEAVQAANQYAAKLEAELKEVRGKTLTVNDLKGEDKASYKSANPEICFEDFYDTEE